MLVRVLKSFAHDRAYAEGELVELPKGADWLAVGLCGSVDAEKPLEEAPPKAAPTKGKKKAPVK